MNKLISIANIELWVPAGPRWFDAVALLVVAWGLGATLQSPALELAAVAGLFVSIWPVLDRIKRWARGQNYGMAGEAFAVLFSAGFGLALVLLVWLVVLLAR